MIPLHAIEYRKAASADSYDLAVLKGKVWNTTYQGIYSDETLRGYDVRKNQQIFDSIISNLDIEVYVAAEHGRIVGFITCGKPFRPFRDYKQEVGLLYILQSHQRRGIGRALFALAQDQVRSTGESTFIISVNRQNTNAIQFYIAMGGKLIATEQYQLRLAFHVDDQQPSAKKL